MIIKNPSDRRDFIKLSLASTLAVGAGVAAVGFGATTAQAAEDDKESMPDAVKPVPNEELFRKGVFGPAELSLATCKLAVEKTTDKQAKEFAGFELEEAIAVTSILKALGTPVPPMSPLAKSTLAALEAAPKGPDFDKAFMTAQLKNHEFLRDHAMDYLKRTAGKSEMAEQHTQKLATLALAVFKEHVALCSRISSEIKV